MSFQVQECRFSFILVLIRNSSHQDRKTCNCINEELYEELSKEEIGLHKFESLSSGRMDLRSIMFKHNVSEGGIETRAEIKRTQNDKESFKLVH